MDKSTERPERQRSALLFPLIAITALFLLSVFFFVIGQDNPNNPIAPPVNRADNSASNARTNQTILDIDEAAARYAQLLPETARESVDAPSDEATAAQGVLLQQSGALARSLSGNVMTINREPVPIERMTEALANFNMSIIEYGTVARAGLVDQTKVDAAAKELSEVFNTKTGEKQIRLNNVMTSYKNAVMESVRNFAQGQYAASYDKQLESQKTAQELFELISS